ncbi:hypothetical protein DRN73_07455 [Candidatus Pacearchaeota archaeon]|nr:MAG: hypothetical protein DRN73_07455 [Candidatus Pacearchaeota archaeon]
MKMLLALDKNKEKIYASPKKIGYCEICGEKLIPRCGDIKIWHWSHKGNNDCDKWAEPESEWHKEWKSYFPKENREVVIKNHRADIKTDYGLVIELQNSSISEFDIFRREKFYGNMIWILNGKTLAKGLELRFNKEYVTFRWKNPPKAWWESKRKKYIDIGEINGVGYLFLIKKIYTALPCGGWGVLIKKEDFIHDYRGY